MLVMLLNLANTRTRPKVCTCEANVQIMESTSASPEFKKIVAVDACATAGEYRNSGGPREAAL